jgi:hypothetical protein
VPELKRATSYLQTTLVLAGPSLLARIWRKVFELRATFDGCDHQVCFYVLHNVATATGAFANKDLRAIAAAMMRP